MGLLVFQFKYDPQGIGAPIRTFALQIESSDYVS